MSREAKIALSIVTVVAIALGFLGAGLQSGSQCSVFGCPLNAGVFASVGAHAAQLAFVLLIAFVVLSVTAMAVRSPFPARPVFRVKIRPVGASQKKVRLWQSLRETSPTAA